MTHLDSAALDAALDLLPARFPGPGGVAGVVKDGRIVGARAWGHADLEAGLAMTRATRLPICSISKQFTCAVLLATLGDPARLDDGVRGLLPNLAGPLPSARQLCDNQSGLRDYWALTVLHGARAEQTFRREDAHPVLARMRSTHFAPGTSYSYCNANFRILGDLIEDATGTDLESLYRRHVWGPAGMGTAVLAADTRAPVDGVVGYEGSDATGFLPAANGIYWIGDAGIAASLEDMLAYEAWIDATRDDAAGLYRRLALAPAFSDGSPARYGFGLAHEAMEGVALTGHGGALRGFRAQRLHASAARLSAVVMLNYEGNAHGAARSLVAAALGLQPPTAGEAVPEAWSGQWIGEETGLLARLDVAGRSAVLRYGTGPEALDLRPDGTLAGPGVTLARTGDSLTMARPGENRIQVMRPLPRLERADAKALAGVYHAEELDATLRIEERDGGVHAIFQGMLGEGRPERIAPAGPDTWTIATRRSMDAPAPGDWTLCLARASDGTTTGLRLGCWLARDIAYRRIA
ncbi:D-aminopeptidase [Zavarzinia sp. CC-PAN008]|uniref:D-aminopeptidase n=1 Tax=Zavarzinia sp. CC-PAN008 TaxID=3243332 RepID=UPI003F746260